MVMQFDLVKLAMNRASQRFGGGDNVFNGANFSGAFCELAGVASGLDGKVVEAILCGRPDCIQLSGGSHYKMIEVTK